MLDIAGAVYGRLSGDSTLLALLAVYGSGRAIVSDPPPADLLADNSLPVLIIGHPAADEANDTYTENYRQVTLSVRLYHRPAGSALPLDTAAERVRTLLRSWPSGAVTGGTLIDAAVSGPVAGPTDDPAVEGRIVTARLLFKES
jgi:hypothetical protein